jgi:hypothetical protein
LGHHSYGKGNRTHLVLVQDVSSSPFCSSDWLQTLQNSYTVDTFPPLSHFSIHLYQIVTLKMEAERYSETSKHILHRERTQYLQLWFTSSLMPLTGVHKVHTVQTSPFMSAILNEVCRSCPQSLYANAALSVTFQWLSFPLRVGDFRVEIVVRRLGMVTGISSFTHIVQTNAGTLPHKQATTSCRFLPKSFAVHHLQVCCPYTL